MFVLTPMQEQCVQTVIDKYRAGQRIITVSGYAGSGKSSCINELIRRLHLQEKTAYVTFTGKASLVLQNKGIPATTIHRLIYDTKEDKYGVRSFKLKEKLEKPDIELIVVDEVSMVSKELLMDLLSFGIPIIALGDHGQLAPIGEDNGLLLKPDFVLTEIIRQAEGNPIIYLSKLVREGMFSYIQNDKIRVYPKSFLDFEIINWADQILCGYNKTRKFLNTIIRQNYFGSNIGPLPVVGDKIICIKNNWNIIDSQGNPLINGAIYKVVKINKNYARGLKFNIDVMNVDTKAFITGLEVNTAPFTNKPIPPKEKRALFDFGYAITVHKAQGSEWNKVVLIDECIDNDTYKNWLYTGITRAIDKLIIIKN